MKKINIIVLFVKSILLLSLILCSSYKPYPNSCYKIEGIAGPEDFVWIEKENLFLISSHNRRDLESYGEIYSYNPNTNKLNILERINEPENLSFRPHGIDYRDPYLFVILHGNTLETKWHAVAIYEYKKNQLILKKLFQNPLIVSPNDLISISQNEFIIINDMKTRGSLIEYLSTMLFGIKNGSLVYCNIEINQCYEIFNGLGFPNSLALYNNKLFVSTTLENKIYEFDFILKNNQYKLENKKQVATIPGPDNFISYQNKLYITSHPSMWKFIQHSKNAENLSPSLGFEIDPKTYQINKIFEDSGQKISAASVILKLNSELFIGQVFNPYLLRCSIK
ncbi:MAG: arylesterase [Leptospiraceae bacterium]|nr:MAG: arylesterase [Leptospiraceae bacterium]